MAWIESLDVSDVRSIANARLFFTPGINVICGHNGSGKTSLLESLFLLSSGKSFRSGHSTSLIRFGADSCAVFSSVHPDERQTIPVRKQGRASTVGVQRSRDGEGQYKIKGAAVNSTAALLQLLPILVINSDTFALLEGAPADRRKFIDWGVFHVEQSFLQAWQRSQRALKQRNSLLRRGKIDDAMLDAWEFELSSTAAEVDRYRAAFVGEINTKVATICGTLQPGLDPPELRYRRGWDAKEDYRDILRLGRQRDAERGFTQSGPHRADLAIETTEGLAVDFLSRGQKKLTIGCLRLAQAETVFARTGRRCIFLLDDLPAELDRRNRARLLNHLMQSGSQVFITASDISDVDLPDGPKHQHRVFHVEQGSVAQV